MGVTLEKNEDGFLAETITPDPIVNIIPLKVLRQELLDVDAVIATMEENLTGQKNKRARILDKIAQGEAMGAKEDA